MTTTEFDEHPQIWLDRLVCGELEERKRAGLLAWLDAEPSRWRTCALAFLESQTWNDSLSALALDEQVTYCEPVQIRKPSSPRSRISTWAMLAPTLLLAFVLGAFSRGWISPTRSAVVAEKEPARAAAAPVMASVSLQPQAGGPLTATVQIPVLPAPREGSAEDQQLRPISEYERHKWQRRGYQLTKERRFLPARLPDGKQIVVPIEQVKASYVGSKVS